MADMPGIGKDSAEAFAQIIATIRRDMEAIEKSTDKIKQNLKTAGSGSGGIVGNASGGAGGTGASKPQGLGLAEITSNIGAGPIMRTGAFAVGGMAGAMGGAGFVPGGIALAALPDLIPTAQQGLNYEGARFGTAQATGDFGTFQRMIAGAKNDFNVQNMQAFQNSIVYGTQRAGMIGLAGGETRASSQIGGFNTMAALAGIDQAAVPGMLKTSMGSQTFYKGLGSGILTRDPRTGRTIGIEQQTNQLWNNSGLGRYGNDTAKQLEQIDVTYGEGMAGRRQLLEIYGGDENMVDAVVNGLRIRARTGEALKENQVQDQMKALGEEGGGLDSEMTQGMEAMRRMEGERLDLLGDHVNDVTEGVAMSANAIADAAETLQELDGVLEEVLGEFIKFNAALAVANGELPGAMGSITGGLSAVGDLLMSAAAGKFLAGGKGGGLLSGGKGLLSKVGSKAKWGWKGIGAGGLIASLGYAGVQGLQGAAGVGEKDFGAMDWLGTMGASAGVGAAAGTAFLPGLGTIIGAIGGAIVGAIDSASEESKDSAYEKKGRSKGDWFVEADQDGRVHYGEMVLPARVATAVREELALGKTSSSTKPGRGGDTTVNIYLTVSRASDTEAMQFASRVKRFIDGDDELLAIGMGRM